MKMGKERKQSAEERRWMFCNLFSETHFFSFSSCLKQVFVPADDNASWPDKLILGVLSLIS